MAFQFTHKSKGIESPKAYAKTSQTNIDHVGKTGQVTLNIYNDKAARAADPTGNVLEQKSYGITPALYDKYFSATVLGAEGVNIVGQSYELAKNTKEGPAPKEGEEDIRKSYFDSATDA